MKSGDVGRSAETVSPTHVAAQHHPRDRAADHRLGQARLGLVHRRGRQCQCGFGLDVVFLARTVVHQRHTGAQFIAPRPGHVAIADGAVGILAGDHALGGQPGAPRRLDLGLRQHGLGLRDDGRDLAPLVGAGAVADAQQGGARVVMAGAGGGERRAVVAVVELRQHLTGGHFGALLHQHTCHAPADLDADRDLLGCRLHTSGTDDARGWRRGSGHRSRRRGLAPHDDGTGRDREDAEREDDGTKTNDHA
ncbi:MAG: hypothetical protein U0P30_00815 [Vicinamibacterales bacterium]